jgi:hypothetical protein
MKMRALKLIDIFSLTAILAPPADSEADILAEKTVQG